MKGFVKFGQYLMQLGKHQLSLVFCLFLNAVHMLCCNYDIFQHVVWYPKSELFLIYINITICIQLELSIIFYAC